MKGARLKDEARSSEFMDKKVEISGDCHHHHHRPTCHWPIGHKNRLPSGNGSQRLITILNYDYFGASISAASNGIAAAAASTAVLCKPRDRASF